MGVCTGRNISFTNIPITIESPNSDIISSCKAESKFASPVFRPRFHRPILQKLIRKRSNSFSLLVKQTQSKQLI